MAENDEGAAQESPTEPVAHASEVKQEETKPPESAPSTSNSGSTAVGAVVWLLIIGVYLYSIYRKDEAHVLLNVSTRAPLTIGGAVSYDGAAVSGGKVQVRVQDAKDRGYLGSAVLAVGQDGGFASGEPNPFAEIDLKQKLSVTAYFVGQTAAKDSKEPKTLTGTATVYLNQTPPLGETAKWWIGSAVLVPMMLLVVLFTGPLTKKKARLLFGVTYLVTFASCVIPIALTVLVSQNPDAVEVMENAPVGILKGKAKGLDRPQWLVNIGGSVKKPPSPEAPRPGGGGATGAQAGPPTAQPAAPGAGGAAGPPATPQQPPAKAEGQAPTTAQTGATPSSGDELPSTEVVGGLAIPLYVIILAMLGAGINMTRKVPEIQKSFDGAAASLKGALNAPLAILGFGASAGQILNATGIRKDLIEVYMYFLSAPFLAVAVYYLLQVIANSVAEPVLVVIAFATGLMSNTVVGTIIVFADKILERARSGQPAEKDAAGSQAKADQGRQATPQPAGGG